MLNQNKLKNASDDSANAAQQDSESTKQESELKEEKKVDSKNAPLAQMFDSKSVDADLTPSKNFLPEKSSPLNSDLLEHVEVQDTLQKANNGPANEETPAKIARKRNKISLSISMSEKMLLTKSVCNFEDRGS
jgi:hypothetical protein